MRIKWVTGKVISTLTLAPGIYAHVYFEIPPGELWSFRATGQHVQSGFHTKADAIVAAEEYLCDILNVAMNNIYN